MWALQSFQLCCCCLVAKLCLTFVILWTVPTLAPLSLGFPRQNIGVVYHFLLHHSSLLPWKSFQARHQVERLRQLTEWMSWTELRVLGSRQPEFIGQQTWEGHAAQKEISRDLQRALQVCRRDTTDQRCTWGDYLLKSSQGQCLQLTPSYNW